MKALKWISRQKIQTDGQINIPDLPFLPIRFERRINENRSLREIKATFVSVHFIMIYSISCDLRKAETLLYFIWYFILVVIEYLLGCYETHRLITTVIQHIPA